MVSAVSSSTVVQSVGGQAVDAEQAKAIRTATREFESILVRRMIQQMRDNSISPYRDQVTSNYVDLADDHFSKMIASQGGFGFGDAMARQLIEQIGVAKRVNGPR
jgi:Rod binding domain-containing protein